jgi:hypothetical protein
MNEREWSRNENTNCMIWFTIHPENYHHITRINFKQTLCHIPQLRSDILAAISSNFCLNGRKMDVFM